MKWHKEDGWLSKRERLILSTYDKHAPKRLTDGAVASLMGFTHNKGTQPSITNLINRGLITDYGKTKDTTTNRMVRECQTTEK